MTEKRKLPADSSNYNVPVDNIDEILDALPQEQRRIIERTMVSSVAMITKSSPESEIANKITSEHITKMLENQEKAMDYSFKDEKYKNIFYGVIIFILLASTLCIILLLKDLPDTMERVLTVLITAVISGLGGYGIGKGNKED